MSNRDKPKTCKDCLKEHSDAVALWNLLPEDSRPPAPKLSKREAPHRGPRCTTHHRLEQKRRRIKGHAMAIAREYGLEPEDYQKLLQFQEGRCYICRRATGRTKRLAVDHDHKTGLVRGLLCSICNHMVAHGRDLPEFFDRAAHYLRHPPARMLGIVAIYKGKT